MKQRCYDTALIIPPLLLSICIITCTDYQCISYPGLLYCLELSSNPARKLYFNHNIYQVITCWLGSPQTATSLLLAFIKKGIHCKRTIETHKIQAGCGKIYSQKAMGSSVHSLFLEFFQILSTFIFGFYNGKYVTFKLNCQLWHIFLSCIVLFYEMQ